MDPIFDGVGYLTDGLQRLNVLDTGGFHALSASSLSFSGGMLISSRLIMLYSGWLETRSI
jgi:hypothetical protein